MWIQPFNAGVWNESMWQESFCGSHPLHEAEDIAEAGVGMLGTTPGSIIHEWENHHFPHVVMIKRDDICERTWKIEIIIFTTEKS